MTMKWNNTNLSFSRKVDVLCIKIDNNRVSLKFFCCVCLPAFTSVFVDTRLSKTVVTSSKLAKRDLLTQQNLHVNLHDFRLLLLFFRTYFIDPVRNSKTSFHVKLWNLLTQQNCWFKYIMPICVTAFFRMVKNLIY